MDKYNLFNRSRKIFHLTGLLAPAVILFDLFDLFDLHWFEDDNRSLGFYILLFLFILIVIYEGLRFRFDLFQHFFIKKVGFMLKEQEYEKMNGAIPFFLSTLLLVGFFSEEIAVLAMLFLLLGDTAAAFVGSRYGKIRFKNGKSLEGTLAGIATALLTGIFFLVCLGLFINKDSSFSVFNPQNEAIYIWVILFIGAISALTLEAVSQEGIFDDNLLVPIGSALIMTCLAVYWEVQETAFYPASKLLFMSSR